MKHVKAEIPKRIKIPHWSEDKLSVTLLTLFLIAAAIIISTAFAMAQDTLPAAMMGNWTMADEEGIMNRADKDSGDFLVEREHYYAVDTACDILRIEKLTVTSYLVQASCHYDDESVNPPPFPPQVSTSEFELKGDKLRVTSATGS
jgi:hypothetical protein